MLWYGKEPERTPTQHTWKLFLREHSSTVLTSQSQTNKLRTKMGHSKYNMKEWTYIEDDDTTCECEEADQTMDYLLEYPLLQQACSLANLIVYNDTTKDCVKQWIGLVQWRYKKNKRVGRVLCCSINQTGSEHHVSYYNLMKNMPVNITYLLIMSAIFSDPSMSSMIRQYTDPSICLCYHFPCPLLLLPPSTVPCRIVFERPEDREIWPYHLGFFLLIVVIKSSLPASPSMSSANLKLVSFLPPMLTGTRLSLFELKGIEQHGR